MTGYGRLQRQEALVGSEGIQKIKEVTLGIIGLSGNGSPLALGAGCAGVQNFKLFDQDKLDEPNLNRFFAGGVKHIEQYKVDLVKEDLTRLDPSAVRPSDSTSGTQRHSLSLRHAIISSPVLTMMKHEFFFRNSVLKGKSH